MTKISSSQVQEIAKIAVQLAAKTRTEASKWNAVGPVLRILMAFLAIGALGTGGWFIYSHKIGPLMLYVAAMIPILCFGIAVMSKNFQRVNNEFEEYRVAMNEFMTTFMSLHTGNVDKETEALAAAMLVNIKDTSVYTKSISDMAGTEAYQKALQMVTVMETVHDAAEMAVKEFGDIKDLLAALDMEDYTDAIENADGSIGSCLFDDQHEETLEKMDDIKETVDMVKDVVSDATSGDALGAIEGAANIINKVTGGDTESEPDIISMSDEDQKDSKDIPVQDTSGIDPTSTVEDINIVI